MAVNITSVDEVYLKLEKNPRIYETRNTIWSDAEILQAQNVLVEMLLDNLDNAEKVAS